jgi:hypothetical protein
MWTIGRKVFDLTNINDWSRLRVGRPNSSAMDLMTVG